MPITTITQIIIAAGVVILILLLLALVVIGVTIINRFDDQKEIKDVEKDVVGETVAIVKPTRGSED